MVNAKIIEFEKAVKVFSPRYVKLYENHSRIKNNKWWELAFGNDSNLWSIKLNNVNELKDALAKIEKIVPVINLELFEDIPENCL